MAQVMGMKVKKRTRLPWERQLDPKVTNTTSHAATTPSCLKAGPGEKIGDFLQRLEKHYGFDLPVRKDESPSKRRCSPNHEAVNYVRYLFYQDRDSLDRALNRFHIESPSSKEAHDPKLTRFLSTVSDAVKTSKAKATVTPRSSQVKNARTPGLSNEASLPPEPPSPSLAVKHAPPVATSTVEYPKLPSAASGEATGEHDLIRPPSVDMNKAFGDISAIRSSSSLFNTSGVRSADRSFTSNTSFPSSGSKIANTSFATSGPTTANTSFASFGNGSVNNSFTGIGDKFASITFEPEPPGAHRRFSTASTINMDGANDIECTPQTYYGSSPPYSQTDYPNVEAADDHPPATQYSGPLSSPGVGSLHDLHAGPDLQQRTPPTSNLFGAPIERGDALETTPEMASQASVSPGDLSKWGAKRIVDDDLPHVGLPASFQSLPWALRWETLRLIQTKLISPQALKIKWRHPRTRKSLYALVDQMNISFHKTPEYGLCECSYAARLVPDTSKGNDVPHFSLELNAPIRQKQNGFERELGCERVITVECHPTKGMPAGLSEDDARAAVAEMITKSHELLGRDWVMFFLREKKQKKRQGKPARPGTMEFYFFATSGDDIDHVSISDFLQRLIPFRENASQLSGKLFSRLELLASRTTKGPVFRRDQIEVLDDRTATDEPDDLTFADRSLDFTEEFDSTAVMTDGCAPITAYAMRLICNSCGWEPDTPLPSAVQGRFFGSKGMWVLQKDATLFDPDAPAPAKLISVSRSQQKVAQRSDQNEFTFVVCAFTLSPRTSVLHPGFLPIMHDRGVPSDIICNAAAFALSSLVTTFQEASQDRDELRSWLAEEEAVPHLGERHLGVPSIGGFPTIRSERIVKMLESGFQPETNRFLANEMHELWKDLLKLKAKKFKIPCMQSTTLTGVADWTGTLAPGEVHLKLSGLSMPTGQSDPSFAELGRTITECLVARNPARRPSDIQRLRIVQKAELSHLTNVIVFSTRGRQAEASKMQGGDYDGDTFYLNWNREIVKHFRNAPAPREANRGSSKNYFLEKDERKFSDIVKSARRKDSVINETEVRKWLKSNTKKRMRFGHLGLCTKFLENVVYHEGKLISEPIEALNDLCDYLLDAHKQCLIFTSDSWRMFMKHWDLRELPDPAYFVYTKAEDDDDKGKFKPKAEPRDDSILDRVYCDRLRKEALAALKVVEAMFPYATLRDKDLDHIFKDRRDAAAEGSAVRRELDSLFDRVAAVKDMWLAKVSTATKGEVPEATGLVRQFYEEIQPLNTDNETIREWTVAHGNSTTTQWDFYKASAFAMQCYHHGKEGTTKMQFVVAGHELCLLKAAAVAGSQTLTSSAYHAMKPIKRKALAALREKRAVAVEEEDEEDDDDVYQTLGDVFDNIDGDRAAKKFPRDGAGGHSPQSTRVAGGLKRAQGM
ncbi:uncharacterized protein LTR77_008184 [Saxophila tyrrhenica]|uniref:RNA-dependent RNA polymerase n=1 Tax=Saxophila tyrrhenica TaxID=1690608 RepID=A0AAV9P212_9PEZI|nr:hypothetical protein LTR77_008184 [Saxophila tyrrhenica]